MLPDRVSNPGPLTYESGALPIALRGPASTCGWGWFGHFYSHLSFLLFLPFFGAGPRSAIGRAPDSLVGWLVV